MSRLLEKMFAILESPTIYRLAQTVFAPGSRELLRRVVEEACRDISPNGVLVDVGCGPRSWLQRAGRRTIAIDSELAYVRELRRGAAPALVGSAMDLPLRDATVTSCWSIGLLHHLDDEQALRALNEMKRVLAPGGGVVVIDGVMPRSAIRRPLAWLIRKFDRGRWLRAEAGSLELLRRAGLVPRSFRRATFAWTGLELVCVIARGCLD